MAKITTWKDIFDFSNPADVNKAIKAISKLDKVYEDLIAATKKGSTQITANNAALVKSLDSVAASSEKLTATNKAHQKEIQETNAKAKALAATYSSQNKQIAALEAQVKKLSKERSNVAKKTTDLNNINKKAIALEAQIGQLTGNSAKENASLALQLANLKKARKLEAQETAGLVTIYQKEVAQLNALQNKYREVALKQGINSTEAKKLNAVYLTQKKRITDVNNSMGQFQDRVGGYSQALGRLRLGFTQVAGALGFTSLIFGVAAAFRDAFGIIKEFDAEINTLASIANKTREQLEPLERTIRKVASSSVNTAVDVAKTATALTALGKSSEDVQLLLKPVNDLSIALKAQADEAGELLIKTLNAFGEGSESAQEYADIIGNMRASTALDFEKIKVALGFLAPTAKAAGVSIEKTGATLGVLVDNAIPAARAGRLMSSSFLRLAEQGLTLDQALISLNRTQSNTTDELELLRASSSLFGKESAALGLILASNIPQVEAYTESFENSAGALDRLTKQQLKSVESQLKILDSEYTELILSIDSGEGVIAGATKSFINLAISIIGAVKAVGEFLATPDPFKDGIIQAEELSKAIGFVLPKAISDYEKQLKSAREEAAKMSIARAEGEKNIFALRAMKDEVLRLEGGLSVLNKALENEADRLAEVEAAKLAAAAAAGELADENERLTSKVNALLSVQGQLRADLETNRKVAQATRRDFELIFGEDTAIQDSADSLLNKVDSTLREIGAKSAASREQELQSLISYQEKKDLITNTAFEATSILANQKFENDSIRRDNEIASLQAQKDRELEIAGDNEQKKSAIEAKFAEKERQIRIKQAKANKKQALFNIAINTAQAILQAIAQFGPPPSPLGIAGIAAAGVIGVTQAAAVVSAPLPAFKDGGTVMTDGDIITSEVGYEYAITPKGELIKTGSNGAEIRSDIPKGSEILTHAMSKQLDSGLFNKTLSHDDSNNSIQEYIKRDKIQTAQIIAHTLKVENDHLAKVFNKAIKDLPEIHQWRFSHGQLVDDVTKGGTTQRDWKSKNNN